MVTDYKRGGQRKTRNKNQTQAHFSCGLSSQLLSPLLTPDFLISESPDNHTQSPFGPPPPPTVESQLMRALYAKLEDPRSWAATDCKGHGQMSIIRTTVNVKVTQQGLGIKDGFEISMDWGM